MGSDLCERGLWSHSCGPALDEKTTSEATDRKRAKETEERKKPVGLLRNNLENLKKAEEAFLSKTSLGGGGLAFFTCLSKNLKDSTE